VRGTRLWTQAYEDLGVIRERVEPRDQLPKELLIFGRDTGTIRETRSTERRERRRARRHTAVGKPSTRGVEGWEGNTPDVQLSGGRSAGAFPVASGLPANIQASAALRKTPTVRPLMRNSTLSALQQDH
jgi:hypothetical protein